MNKPADEIVERPKNLTAAECLPLPRGPKTRAEIDFENAILKPLVAKTLELLRKHSGGST